MIEPNNSIDIKLPQHNAETVTIERFRMLSEQAILSTGGNSPTGVMCQSWREGLVTN
jgi:hypothetical protein